MTDMHVIPGIVRVQDHPNGFLKLVLTEDPDGSATRLHLWDTAGGDSDIHQHRGDFASTVLRGVLTEKIYGYEDDPRGDHDRMLVNCWTDGNGTYHVDEERPRVRCRVKVIRTEIHRASETYYRDARDLHRAFASSVPLVTLVRFGPSYQQVHTMIRTR